MASLIKGIVHGVEKAAHAVGNAVSHIPGAGSLVEDGLEVAQTTPGVGVTLTRFPCALGAVGAWVCAAHTSETGVPDELKVALTSGPSIVMVSIRVNPEGVEQDNAWFVSFDNGELAFSANLPDDLKAKLTDTAAKANGPALFLAPNGGYLLTFAKGPRDVITHGIPPEAQAAVEQAIKAHGGVESAAFGPAGEWYVLAADNKYIKYAGLNVRLQWVMQSPDPIAGPIHHLSLGPNGSYCAQFSSLVAWCAPAGLGDAVHADIKAAGERKHVSKMAGLPHNFQKAAEPIATLGDPLPPAPPAKNNGTVW